MNDAVAVGTNQIGSSEPVLAIDVGGTKIAVALVRGSDVLARRLVTTPAADGPEAVIAAAVGSARGLLNKHRVVPEVVGAACAGVVVRGRVSAMSVDLMPGWIDYPLEQRLATELGLPIVVLNDAQAAAFGESVYGAGRGRGSMLFVTVSTGVGGGLVLNGRLWTGATGLAGHVGQTRDGVLEQIVSGTALARRAADRGHEVGAREVLAAAESGAAWATELLRDAVTVLRGVLLDVKMVVDPEVVVLGGSVGMNPVFMRALTTEIASAGSTIRLEVAAAELGADAGLVGAARWARAFSRRQPRATAPVRRSES